MKKRVMDAVEDYLEGCAQVVVDVEVVERLLRLENLEDSMRYVLRHATRRGSNIFQLFDTSEKPNHFVASRRRWLESQGRDGARQENVQKEWYNLEYQGASAREEEEDHWELREERRRRRIAFRELGQEHAEIP